MSTNNDQQLVRHLQGKLGKIDAELEKLFDIERRIEALREQRATFAHALSTLGVEMEEHAQGNGAMVKARDVSEMTLRDAILAVTQNNGKPMTTRQIRLALLKAGWSTKSKNPDNVLRNTLRRFDEGGKLIRSEVDGKIAYEAAESNEAGLWDN